MIGDAEYVGYPLWSTIINAKRSFLFRVGFNDIGPARAANDPSTRTNAAELRRLGAALVAQVGWGDQEFHAAVDWSELAAATR